MEKPFRFIECKTTDRKEFNVTEGRQPTFAFFYLKEGSFRLRMDGREEIVEAGDCALFTDDVNFTRSVIRPLSFVYLKFCVNPKCPFTLPLPVGRVEVQDRERLLANIARYEEWADSDLPHAPYYREHILEDILLQISDEYADGGRGAGTATGEDCRDPLVRCGTQHVRDHLRERLTSEVLCRALSTNQTTLNFKFRRELAMSVGEFIAAERMRTARKLLETTTFSVSEIAARSGYEGVFYFSNVFKRHHGISPSAYRKAHQG